MLKAGQKIMLNVAELHKEAPHDWAAMIFGLLACAISIFNFFKAFLDDRKSLHRYLSDKRDSLQSLVINAELSFAIASRQLNELRLDALLDGATDIAKQCEELLKTMGTQIEIADLVKEELKKAIPYSDPGRKLEDSLDVMILTMKELSSKKIIEENGRDYIDPARQNLRLRKIVEQQGGSAKLIEGC
jgi:hypothetical protein